MKHLNTKTVFASIQIGAQKVRSMNKTVVILLLAIVGLVNLSFAKQPETIYYPETRTKITRYTVPTIEEYHKYAKEQAHVPFTGKTYIGFTQAIGFKESRNRYHVVNKFGYLGKYQFGASTLERLHVYNTQAFLNNPVQQEKAFEALCSVNKYILRKDIKRFVGKKINGVLITESGMLAAAHLGGAGNVKKFLRSYGKDNKKDQLGTSIQDYIEKFQGYDVSHIEANKNARV